MKRVLISIIIVLILTECSQQKYVTTKWEKQSYKAIDSIPVFDYYYDTEGKLFYMVTNDSSNLYVHLKIADESAQKKISRFGFQTWIDITAKNKKQMGVKFPLPANERMDNVPLKNEGPKKRRNFDAYKNMANNQLMEIELVGFSDKNSSQFLSANNNNSVNGIIEINKSGDILYLLTIPFISLGIEYKPDMYLSLNLESGYLSEDMKPERMTGDRPGGMSGGRPGGAGGRSGNMGGGSPGEMRGGRNPQVTQQRIQERQQLSTPIKIQLKKVKLL